MEGFDFMNFFVFTFLGGIFVSCYYILKDLNAIRRDLRILCREKISDFDNVYFDPD